MSTPQITQTAQMTQKKNLLISTPFRPAPSNQRYLFRIRHDSSHNGQTCQEESVATGLRKFHPEINEQAVWMPDESHGLATMNDSEMICAENTHSLKEYRIYILVGSTGTANIKNVLSGLNRKPAPIYRRLTNITRCVTCPSAPSLHC